MTDAELSYEIKGAAMAVYNHFGPGLLESVYQQALLCELELRGLKVESEVLVPIFYKGKKIHSELRLDVLVEDRIVVELKSVEELLPIHYKQLRTYLRLLNKPLGWLVNFGAYDFKKGVVPVGNKGLTLD